MTTSYAYLYVTDTLADWEIGYLTAELDSGRYFAEAGARMPVRTAGLSLDPVTTKGGLRVVPDTTVDRITAEDAGVLILPGGDTWLEPAHDPVLAKVVELLEARVPVAAVCGATMALANAGLLNERPHTSNNLGALQAVCPGYEGEDHFRGMPAVTDGDLITASGVAPLHFAKAVLERLGVFSATALDAWYRLNAEQEESAYFELMGSLPQPAAAH